MAASFQLADELFQAPSASWILAATTELLFRTPLRPKLGLSPRDEHLELLIEVGLGVHRHLNEEQAKLRQPTLGPEAFSFWFLANRLGRRLLRSWGQRLVGLQAHGPGVWRCPLLGRTLFLVSGTDLPVEEASLPFHLIARESGATEEAVARLVAGRAELWERYGSWLASLHPAAYKKVLNMAKQTKEPLRLDLTPIVETMGMAWVVKQLGVKQVVEEVGLKQVVKEVGLKQVVEEVGLKQVVEQFGLPLVVDEVGGVQQFWEGLSPAQQQELKQLLRQ